MNDINNPNLTANAQDLRANMTKEEKHLWYDFLSLLSVTINRQKVIGNYIVDFYCAESKVVIEVDGSQHYDGAVMAGDAARDRYLRNLGITVLRYSNLEVNTNFKCVCEDILKYIPCTYKQ